MRRKRREDEPDQEPITLEEAKNHLRVHHDLEDALIESLITAAREWCEDFQNRAYLTQEWVLYFDELQYDVIRIPRPPLQQVNSIVVVGADDVQHDVTDYEVDDNPNPARLKINEYPAVDTRELSSLQIEYTAGHESPDDVSDKVKNAIKLLVGHWYKNREAVVAGTVPRPLEMAVTSLLSQNRIMPI